MPYKYIVLALKLLSMSVANPCHDHGEVRNHDSCIVLALLTHTQSLQNDLLSPLKHVLCLLDQGVYHFMVFVNNLMTFSSHEVLQYHFLGEKILFIAYKNF